MQRELQGSFFEDDAMADGYVEYLDTPEGPRICMTFSTFQSLWRVEGALRRLFELCQVTGQHTFLLPRGIVEPEEAAEVRLGLSLVDPVPSEHCIYPPCILPAEVEHPDGFLLCGFHNTLLTGWDDLLTIV